MKKLVILILVILSFSMVAQDKAEIIPITNDLNTYLNERSDNDLIRINIRLKNQFNSQSLKTQLASLDRFQRRELVKNELKAFSAASQADLLNYLESRSYYNEAEIVHSFWIANVVTCLASESVIYELAMRNDIERIDIDEERNLLMDAPSSIPNQLKGTDEITYNVNQVNAPDVWALGFTGEGVVVSVIDSGVNYNHEDLADHMWEDPSYPNHGWDFYNNDNDPMDGHSHGTHCAGTVAGDGTAGSQTGMAPDATIMALKVLADNGDGAESNVWEAIEFTVDNGGDVISMSLGWSHSWNPDRATWRTTLDNALAAGVIASIAAGNEGGSINNPDDVRTPGDCPPPWLNPDQTLQGGISAVVCVGATDSNDNIASFSSLGPTEWESIDPYFDYPFNPEMGLIRPDVSAPGVDVKSCDAFNTSGYSFKSGTSMATPGVAGVMALLLSKNDNLTPEEITIVLETTAIDLGTSGKDNVFGSGRIDALEAINNVNFPGPVYDSHLIDDENNNGEIESGESVLLSIEMFNGSVDSYSNVDVTLSSPSTFISISDNNEFYGNFAPQEYKNINNGFAFDVVDGTPGNELIRIDVEATDGNEVWNSNFNIMTYGPRLEFGNLIVDDAALGNGNGRLDPGETADLTIAVNNSGQASASNIQVNLDIPGGLVVPGSNQHTIPLIGAGGSDIAVFTVIVSDDAPIGSAVVCGFDLQSGVFTNSKSIVLKIGLIVEDWESNSFDQFSWTFDDEADWFISDVDPFEGLYCSQSGNITHLQSSTLLLTYSVGLDDSISFYKEVSSEANYDYLKFYIDNVLQDEWSGEVEWSRSVFPVIEGTHTFKWEYYKDQSVNGGNDLAKVDFIVLPPGLMPTVDAGVDASICQDEDFQTVATAENYNSLLWSSSGDGSFSDETMLNPIYTPGTNDIENAEATLTLTAYGDNGNISNSMDLDINSLPEIPETPEGTALLCINPGEISYGVNSAEGHSYSWEINPVEAGATQSDSAIAIVSWSQSYVGDAEIRIRAINNCGESELSSQLIVTIMGEPEMPVAPEGETSLCINPGEITYNTDPTDECTYLWEISPPEAGVTGSDSSSAIIEWSDEFMGEAEIRVSAVNECGESEFSEALVITVSDIPETPLVPEGEISLCVNTEESVYETLPNDAYTYSWEIIPPEAGTTESDSATAVVSWSDGYIGEVDIRVLAIGECGESEFSEALTVAIHPNPDVSLGEDMETCIGMVVTLDAGNEGATFLWSTGEITQTIEVDTTGMDENNTRIISVMVNDIYDCSSEDEIAISFLDCSDIPEKNYLSGIEIFPNPNNGHFTIKLNAHDNQKAQIELISTNGELVYSNSVEFVKGANEMKVRVNHLTNQLYYLRVVSNKATLTKKVIIKK